MMKLITCERCGKQEMRHYSARFCLDCKSIIQREHSRQAYERKKKKPKEAKK